MEELKVVVKALDEKLANDIKVIKISDVNPLCEYFVICTGNNERHMASLATELRNIAMEKQLTLDKIEGINSDTWVLVDLGDIVVHIFSKDGREKYSLEKLWGDLPTLSIENVLK